MVYSMDIETAAFYQAVNHPKSTDAVFDLRKDDSVDLGWLAFGQTKLQASSRLVSDPQSQVLMASTVKCQKEFYKNISQ